MNNAKIREEELKHRASSEMEKEKSKYSVFIGRLQSKLDETTKNHVEAKAHFENETKKLSLKTDQQVSALEGQITKLNAELAKRSAEFDQLRYEILKFLS